MNQMIRVVLDTNVLISGLFGLPDRPPVQILVAVRAQRIILVTSPALIEELRDVLSRDKVVKLLHMTAREREDFIDDLIQHSDVTAVKPLSQTVSRDMNDDKFIACAVEASARYLITGDKDLLSLKVFQQTTMITPRDFVEQVLE